MINKKNIDIKDLVCMNDCADEGNFSVDLAYASDNNFLFGERIYRSDAKLWLHKDLAKITLEAAKICFERYNICFVLYDGLRTIDAQKAMMITQKVKNNPQWLEEPRLLSPAGAGGHPRGMAIDIGLKHTNGKLLDMGCVFDFLAENPHPEYNPAHREYNHPKDIMDNRNILDSCMKYAGDNLGTEILPLPEEWWDFRLPPTIFNKYEPLSDNDLPPNMRMVN